jgi:hypothetical protein
MGTRGISTPTAQITFHEERGYVHLVHLPGCKVTKQDAVELVEAMVKLTGGRKYPLLCDVSRAKSVDYEARKYFNAPGARTSYSAMALVGGTPIGNVLANFGLALHSKEGSPTKLFTSERDALEWLSRFMGK